MLENARSVIANGLTQLCRRIVQPPIRLARRFVRHQEGATAVEFALVAAPFLALIFAILETAIVFFAGQTLETAVADSARLIMTGQAQTATTAHGVGFNAADFKTAVCGRLFAMFNCTNIYVDVQTYSNFSGISQALPIDSNGNLMTSGFGYNPGATGQITVVRIMYQWPIFVSLFDINQLSDMAGHKRLLIATAAFRNEPY
jgi:Flp pilus assembly protein TadG